MQRIALLTFIGFLALVGAAFAEAPGTRHAAWATGRIARVDSATHAVVVKQGSKEITFTLASDAKLMHGSKALTPTDLGGDVGQPVKVRYSMADGSRVADLVEVGTAPVAHAAVKHPAAKH